MDVADARRHLASLIARTAKQDRAAFEQLYRETSRRLYGVALRIVREPHLAQDVIQDAFIRLWRYAHTFNPDLSAPETWLHQIVRNRALDMVTQQPQTTGTISLEQFGDDEGEDSEGSLEASTQDVDKEEHEAIRGCLSRLEGKYRQVLTLAFNHGMSHAEIADHIGVPLGTVKTWSRRGLAELKSLYESSQLRMGVGRTKTSGIAATA